MTRDHWAVDTFLPITVCLSVWWLLLNAWIGGYDLIGMWRDRHRILTPGAPDPRSSRHILRPTPISQGPHMPSDDEVQRIGRQPAPGQYGEPPATMPAFPQSGGTVFPEPVKPRRDRRRIVAGGLALLVTLAIIVGGGIGYIAYKNSTKTGTFLAAGSLTLRDTDSGSAYFEWDEGKGCHGVDGYDDINPGATVTVRDASGKTIAVGELQGGQPGDFQQLSFGTAAYTCTFSIFVRGIPDNSKFYSFEVSHRGQVTMSREDADHPQLTLGH